MKNKSRLNRIKKALNKSILDLSEYAKQKCDFCFAYKFNDLSSLNLAIHPCIAGACVKLEFHKQTKPE